MAKRKVEPGRLIALEGLREADLPKAGKRLLRLVGEKDRRGGISRWDASGLFFQLAGAARDVGVPSPKTLLMLYAADLAFRLRWEIEPLIREGRDVVATPYIQTAIGFGLAVGIDSVWLAGLFRFAPWASATYRTPHKLPGATEGRPRGFVEYSIRMLAGAGRLRRADVRRPLNAHLEKLPLIDRAAMAARTAI